MNHLIIAHIDAVMFKPDAVHTYHIAILWFFQKARICLQVQRLPHIAGKFICGHKNRVDPAANSVTNLIDSVFNLIFDAIRQFFIKLLPNSTFFHFVFVNPGFI